MALFTELRTLGLLRQIAVALERIATADETLARYASEADDRRVSAGYRPRPKQMEVSTFDQVSANRQWRKRQVESGYKTYEELEEEFGPLPDR